MDATGGKEPSAGWVGDWEPPRIVLEHYPIISTLTAASPLLSAQRGSRPAAFGAEGVESVLETGPVEAIEQLDVLVRDGNLEYLAQGFDALAKASREAPGDAGDLRGLGIVRKCRGGGWDDSTVEHLLVPAHDVIVEARERLGLGGRCGTGHARVDNDIVETCRVNRQAKGVRISWITRVQSRFAIRSNAPSLSTYTPNTFHTVAAAPSLRARTPSKPRPDPRYPGIATATPSAVMASPLQRCSASARRPPRARNRQKQR